MPAFSRSDGQNASADCFNSTRGNKLVPCAAHSMVAAAVLAQAGNCVMCRIRQAVKADGGRVAAKQPDYGICAADDCADYLCRCILLAVKAVSHLAPLFALSTRHRGQGSMHRDVHHVADIGCTNDTRDPALLECNLPRPERLYRQCCVLARQM